nr:putative ribonuclease H-like domain-containing protein [Tanacetum cinerariifolium]
MTGNISYLSDFEEINGGYVAFGKNPKGGKMTGKGKIRTCKLDFDDVYFVKELKFNLFSVSQMYDKKNSVLFTDTECIVLSFDFKLPDENHVLLRVPRENNMYNVDLKNIVPSGNLTCLFAKATLDESQLPTKVFENDNSCVACKKGKQYRASCKTKPVSSVDQPLFRLHMDLFGPTFVKSMNKKSYCLVITDDYSRFTWVFFLDTKDETSPILKTFITGQENQLSLIVKVIRSDNGTEFKNSDLNQFCGLKGIKREFSNLVRGLPTKVFENNNTYVACKKGKQHRASCKTKPVSSIDQTLFRLHMDLFGPSFVKIPNKKSYCLVITDDYSRFTWVFFLATKDETSPILKTFITGLENQLSVKVKVIRSDNETEFKNSDLNQFCELNGIKREFSVPRTPQQNGIAERKNKTLIEAARTMLADLLLPIPF